MLLVADSAAASSIVPTPLEGMATDQLLASPTSAVRGSDVLADRMASWRRYADGLGGLVARGRLEIPTVPQDCQHNGHLFYVKTANLAERSRLLAYLSERGTSATFHFIPLHSADAGRRFGELNSWTVSYPRSKTSIGAD